MQRGWRDTFLGQYMDKNLHLIHDFLQQHHVMSLATKDDDEISVCSLFYAYDEQKNVFVVASDQKTTHIKHIQKNNRIAGNILLETKKTTQIQGVQFRGIFTKTDSKELKKLYFQKFPYAVMLRPELWQISVDYFKMTHNKLGFGKKIIWQDALP